VRARACGVAAAIVSLLGPAVAQAEVPRDVVEAAPGEPRFDHRDFMGQLSLGYRGSFVTSSGYNPFSTNDYLPQFSLAATHTLAAANYFSFAAGLAWDNASTGALSRSDQTSLTLNRLTVPLEGRLHFGSFGYAFARVAPGVAAITTKVVDASAPGDLTKDRWVFATDVSGGYAVLIAPRDAWRRIPRLWLEADGGYGWVVSERLDLTPGGGASGVDLGSLALSAAFFRVSLAVTY
jgi:hypothetical protein